MTGSFFQDARLRLRPKTAMTFEDFARAGFLRVFSVRLPVTTIAKVRLIQERHPELWRTSQELMFDLIENAIEHAVEKEKDERLEKDLQRAASRAMQKRASGLDGDGDSV